MIFQYKYYLISFLIHWFFIAFTRTGADHDQYIYIIEYDALYRFANGEEVGFNGLCIILQKFIGNAEIVIWIFKTTTLLLFYYSFYLIRDKISLGFTIAAYNAWQYFFGFCIIAHSLAISIIVLSIVLLFRKKNKLYIIPLVILASTIHNSAILLIPIFIGLLLSDIIKFKINKFTTILLIIMAFIVIYNIKFLFQQLVTRVDNLSDYEKYNMSENIGSGIFNYILYTYIFLCLIVPIQRSDMDQVVKNTAIVFAIFGFVSSIMGYYLRSSRLNHYVFILYGICIPWYFYQLRFSKINKNKKYFIGPVEQKVTWILFILFAIYSSLMERTNPYSNSEMANYVLYNPFSS